MKPTIADVAQAAGVSRTSVSFAFNKPERVADSTLARILSIASDLGYVPDPVARSMTSGRTGTVVVLLPQSLAEMTHNPFFADFLAGVSTAVDERELPVLLVSPKQGSMERAVNDAAVDGFLTLGLEEFRTTIRMLEARRLPFVMVDSEPVPGLSCVNSDDTGGAYLAMRAVLEAGHRRIAILGIRSPHSGDWKRYTGTLARRVAGYRRALVEFALDMGDVALVEADVSERAGMEAAARLLKRRSRPTAIVSMSDIAALGALEAAAAKNIAVPAALSVVAFDGIPEGRWSRPALTTVLQDSRAKGRVAGDLLLGLIDGTRQPEHVVLATSLVPGETLATRR